MSIVPIANRGDELTVFYTSQTVSGTVRSVKIIRDDAGKKVDYQILLEVPPKNDLMWPVTKMLTQSRIKCFRVRNIRAIVAQMKKI